MEPKASKNQRLIRQYPFLKSILAMGLEPLGVPTPNRTDSLTISFQKADGDLMYRQADNTGLGDYTFVFNLSHKRKNQVMRRGEHLFAVGHHGHIINTVDWPRNEDDRRRTGEVYGYFALWGKKIGPGHLTSCLYNEVEYLVWVTVEAWYRDTRSDDAPGARFGGLVERNLEVAVYQKPTEGFDELSRSASMEENLVLTSRKLINGYLDQRREIVAIGGRLDELTRLFEDEVYFKGMKDVLDHGEFRGASGQLGPVKVMCGELCGYDRVQLEDSVSVISFQLRPGEEHLYPLGMYGTLPQLRYLVKTAVKFWNERPKVREAFAPDANVSVL